jgi:glycosyltransferase involved in cell wall biosynthesis
MRILLPISIDRWRNPISTLLRACVEANPRLEFHSASNPASAEDVRLGKSFWALPNIVKSSQAKLATTRFDGVHTASITSHNQAAVVAAKLRSAGRCRYLATVNLQVDKLDGKDWRLLQIAEMLADGLVAVSQAAATGLSARCLNRFLEIIPNGFDPEYFDPTLEDDAVLPDRVHDLLPRSYALYVGALEPRKHPEFVVELARRHPDITFVGAGYVHPDGRHFEAIVNSQPNLLWLGHVDRSCIRALLKRAGVLLFPSEREGLALSVIEAMGMGLPVICQNKSSMPELIQDGINGRIHNISNIDDWSHSLYDYLSFSEQKRYSFSLQARHLAVERYSWSSIGCRYGQIYKQLFA